MDDPVEVWSCPLDVPEASWRALTGGLPADERAEAGQRRDELDRRRFLAARGWRRRVLATQLNCEPADVPILIDDRGKPHVHPGHAEGGRLRFSASRSAERCLIACSWGMEVGVDIEAVDPSTDVSRFAAALFHRQASSGRWRRCRRRSAPRRCLSAGRARRPTSRGRGMGWTSRRARSRCGRATSVRSRSAGGGCTRCRSSRASPPPSRVRVRPIGRRQVRVRRIGVDYHFSRNDD